MKTDTVDKLIWTLIFGGLITLGLGVSVQRGDSVVGWLLMSFGGVASVVGVVLVYVRSRMKDPL
jgi:hypothetical protein